MLNGSPANTRSWRGTLDSYRDIRLLYIFLLGCSSGFPWVLVGSALNGWLTDAGLSRSAIGYVGSVTVVYAINFIWAPLLDRVALPSFYQRFGQRRGWILLMQTLMFGATLALATSDPAQNLLHLYLIALAIATFSATQDVAVDAYRIDIIGADSLKLPPAAAMGTIGWTTGYSLPGFVAFWYADAIGWQNVYLLLAAIMGLMMLFTLIVREPASDRKALQKVAEQAWSERMSGPDRWWRKLAVQLLVTMVEPFADFFRRNGWRLAVTILVFVFLFKIGEAFLGRMSIVFYREIGFSNEQIGEYSKFVGWIATVIFTLIGSAINVRFGILRGLFIGGVAMAASNLMFAWIALVGPVESLFLATILVDNFTTAFSIVAFVAFLSWLTGRAFSASQYALLASLGNLGRTTLASFSGQMVDALEGNWALFFVITALMVIPGLMALLLIGRLYRQRAAAESKRAASTSST